jgi:hypothetical protein
MKKNNTAYFIISTDDRLCPGNYMPFSFAARHDEQGMLFTLNLNITNFLNF